MWNVDKKIEQADAAVDVINKAAKSAQSVPIGWMFVIMMGVIITTYTITYKLSEKNADGTIEVLQNELKGCKEERTKMENYFIYKVKELETKVTESDSTLREEAKPFLQKIKRK